MAARRNAPSPCGSERKYKHCCGRTAVQDFPAPVRLVKAQLDPARNALLRFASREYGIDAIAEAWEEFSPYDFDQDDYDDDALLAEVFDGPDGGLFTAWNDGLRQVGAEQLHDARLVGIIERARRLVEDDDVRLLQ